VPRTGVLRYRDGTGREWCEYRPPEEVFAADSLATLRAAPVTDGHPSEMVRADSWTALARGHVDGAPVSEGSLCAKGAGFFDLTEANKHRLTKVLYRKPYGTEWEEKDWDFALSRIARLIKDTRDKDFVVKNAKGELVNRCESIGHYGSSNVDNEECWIMSVKCRALGMVYIDHQARV